MMSRYEGEIIMLPKKQGALQYVNEKSKGFLLLTGHGEDIYLPVGLVNDAMESEWDYETTEKAKRRMK